MRITRITWMNKNIAKLAQSKGNTHVKDDITKH